MLNHISSWGIRCCLKCLFLSAGCLGYLAPGPRSSYRALGPGSPKNFQLTQPPPIFSPVTMIMIYGLVSYLNHVDLLMPHVQVLKEQSYFLMCT